ncbi:MAG: TonB-dependent receptor [Porticoccaceae bacterium]|nr:TonB-dependent receptor [Pseudomonadales bacterium]MCP5172136.1 TonB-dependent receptor [Pseudomonadales bacterium]
MDTKKTHQSLLKSGLLLSSLSVAISGIVGAQLAHAEEGEAGAKRSIDEVVVTARRKEESLQDVPIAVSAFGAEQIKQRGIDTEADLQVSTPGLQVRVTNSSNQLNYSLRGQTVDSFSNSQPAVLAYVNEVQTTGVSASSFFDMESIQVLKGPQGTLFGRNATGGAVLYQAKRPENEFGGYVTAGIGSFDAREFEGAVNIPLTDELAMRVSGLRRTRDGWQDNLYNGDELAEDDTENVRLSLSFNGDRLQNHFMGYYAEHRGKTEGLKVRNAYECLSIVGGVCAQGEPNPNNPSIDVGDLLFASFLYPEGVLLAPGALDDNPRLLELGQQMGFTGFGSYVDAANAQLDYDEVINNESNDSVINQKLFTNTTVFEISDSMTLKNIIGYNVNESFQSTDVDGSPFMLLKMGNETDTGAFGNGYQYNYDQFSDELQISGDLFGGDLSYIAGVYYYKEKFENNIPLKFIADYTTDPFGPEFTYHAEVEDESKSVFAQATYALTEALNLTVGGRHTWEEVTIQHKSDSAYFGLVPPSSTIKVDRPSWLISLDYRINEENMVYLAHRGSWRTGGFNLTSINVTPNGIVPDSFKPEKAQDIEAGWKFSGDLAGIPARINVAAYKQVIEDVQRTVYLQITSLTGNVEEAEVKGVEIDAQFDLTDWLEVGGAFAYTDAEFTKPLGDVVGYNFEFGPYADAPEYQWSVYFMTQTHLDGLGDLTFRGDYYSNDDTYFSNLNDSIGPGTELDSYELLNFRASLADIAGTGFTAVAFLRNATDEEYERGGLPLAGVTATNATIIGEPRTWGLQVTYNF